MLFFLSPSPALGQTPANLYPDWRRIGSLVYEAGLASPAGGPVERVWYSLDGSTLFAKLADGRTFETRNLETWREVERGLEPIASTPLSFAPGSLPEPEATVRQGDSFGARLYAFGRHVYRSDDGGGSWTNLTSWRGWSIIGDGAGDLAVNPSNPDELAVANSFGVWVSRDAGLSWFGLNEGLPNFPGRILVSAPSGSRGVRVGLASGLVAEWVPGENRAWTIVAEGPHEEQALLARFSALLDTTLTLLARTNEVLYAAAPGGSIWVSEDGGASWRLSRPEDGAVVVDLRANLSYKYVAFALLNVQGAQGTASVVLRTLDGGSSWQRVPAPPDAGVLYSLETDPTGSALYLAGQKGVFLSVEGERSSLGQQWIRLSSTLPSAPARHVRLDQAGNQLFVLLDGHGVYSAPAPHRLWRIEVASAADLTSRPAAPGSLLTVIGGRLLRARAGLLPAPVIFATDVESQLHLPFDLRGSSTLLELELAQGRLELDVPLREASPGILVDKDGTPLLMDADTGLLLDASQPAKPGTTIQILATGLGRVVPPWRPGLPAPVADPPKVALPVQAYLNGFIPLKVTRAVLAPGYVGFYLVEIHLPGSLEPGPAELHLEVLGQISNKVRIYLLSSPEL